MYRFISLTPDWYALYHESWNTNEPTSGIFGTKSQWQHICRYLHNGNDAAPTPQYQHCACKIRDDHGYITAEIWSPSTKCTITVGGSILDFTELTKLADLITAGLNQPIQELPLPNHLPIWAATTVTKELASPADVADFLTELLRYGRVLLHRLWHDEIDNKYFVQYSIRPYD